MKLNFDPNLLFYEMVDLYRLNRFEQDDQGYILDSNGNKKRQRVVICNEGGTRSSKTWDFFHFLVFYCDHNRGKENEIYILRETLVKCRDFTLKEFKKCLKKMNVWDENNFTGSPKPYYNLYGNHVYFRGMDDEDDSEGYPSDIVFINESLETKEGQSAGIKMRCRKLFVYDWNPKYTRHWCFDLEVQPNTFFTHSTYLNNKHLEASIITDIKSYEPWLPGSYEIKDRKLYYKDELITEKNQPPDHPENVKNKTANEFRWKVYGLGLRGAMEGLILTNVDYDKEWPEDLDFIYINDFGFTSDPNALIKYGERNNDIYVTCLGYHPIETPVELNRFFEGLEMDRSKMVIADSSDKRVSEHHGTIEMVKAMRLLKWNMRKVSKTKGIMYWLMDVKERRIHIVKDKKGLWKYAQSEFENYRLKVMDGYTVNEPDPKCEDHFIDDIRYGRMTYGQTRVSH